MSSPVDNTGLFLTTGQREWPTASGQSDAHLPLAWPLAIGYSSLPTRYCLFATCHWSLPICHYPRLYFISSLPAYFAWEILPVLLWKSAFLQRRRHVFILPKSTEFLNVFDNFDTFRLGDYGAPSLIECQFSFYELTIAFPVLLSMNRIIVMCPVIIKKPTNKRFVISKC